MELVSNFSISGISNLMGVTNEEPATMATAAQVIMSHLVHDITILSPLKIFIGGRLTRTVT